MNAIVTAAVAAGVFVGLAERAGANGTYQCECSDRDDIQQKIDEAEAAIRAYQSEFRNLWNAAYTVAGRNALNAKAQEAINKALKGRRPMQSRGHVDNNCDIFVQGPTKCLQTATSAHEQVHQRECLNKKNADKILESILTGKDRYERDNFTMIMFAQEEIDGYTAALNYLKDQREKLKTKCK